LLALAQRLAPEAVAELPALRGVIAFDAVLSGSVAHPRGELKLTAARLSTAGAPHIDVELSSSLDAAAGNARLSAQVKDSEDTGLRSKITAESKFTSTPEWLGALIAGQHRLAVELGALELDWVAAASGITLPLHGRLEGQLNAELGTRLTLDWRASGTVHAQADPGKLAFEHTLAVDERGVHTALRTGGASDPVLSLDASLQLPLTRDELPLLVARGRSLALSQAWSLELDAPPRDIQKVPLRSLLFADTELPALKVGLHAAIVHAPHAEPSVHVAASAQQLKPFEESKDCKPDLLSAALDAELNDGKLTAKLSGAQARQRLLSSELSAGFSLAKLLAGERVKPTDVQLRARVEGANLAALPQVCGRAHGKVDLDLTLSEPLEDAPKAKATLQVHDLTLANDTLSVRAELEADARSARAKAEIQSASKISKLSARMPLRWSGGTLALDRTHELSAQLKLDALPIAPFLPASTGLSYASGNIGGQVTLSGALSNPQLAGKLELNDVAFTVTDLAQPIDHVRGSISFDGRKLAIEKLTAQDKSGKLELTASANLKSRDEASGKLHLVLDEFPLRQNGEVAATVQGDFTVAADFSPALAHIQLKIDRFDTYLESIKKTGGIDLTPHPDLTVNGVPNNKPKLEVAASEEKPETVRKRPLQLDIQSTRFWVKRDDFAMRLSADITGLWKNGETKFTGEILIERGYVDLLGKQFEVTANESKLTFSGDSGTPDPIVHIRAHHENRKTGDIIGVKITGRSSAPELVFTVNDKKVDAGGAVSAIYGEAQYDPHAQKNAQVQASAVLMGLTAGLVATAARRELGVLAPMLMIDPGTDNSGARVRAGFEFDSLVPEPLRDIITGVYVEGIVSNEKPGSEGESSGGQSLRPGALLELYFPHNLFTAGQYGPGTTWSLDVGWQL
ncbi:MAG TPA: translocation/assembly module TamB domain-containing protein, partial [Polyangiales bacterium]|nr:translocation/assembly module TamB domain-containing protein [Polyangiales bacterium]